MKKLTVFPIHKNRVFSKINAETLRAMSVIASNAKQNTYLQVVNYGGGKGKKEYKIMLETELINSASEYVEKFTIKITNNPDHETSQCEVEENDKNHKTRHFLRRDSGTISITDFYKLNAGYNFIKIKGAIIYNKSELYQKFKGDYSKLYLLTLDQMPGWIREKKVNK